METSLHFISLIQFSLLHVISTDFSPTSFSYKRVIFTIGGYFFPNKHIILHMLSVYYIRGHKLFLDKINCLL